MIVKYSKKFPYAPYLNEDIGFEMEVDVDPNISAEVVLDSLSLLKSIAEKFHKDNNPQLTDANNYDFYRSGGSQTAEYNPQTGILKLNEPIPSLDRKAIERLEILIDDATTTEELNGYEEEAKRLGLYEYLVGKHNSIVIKSKP